MFNVTNNGLSGSDLLNLVGSITANPSAVQSAQPFSIFSPNAYSNPAEDYASGTPYDSTGSTDTTWYWIAGALGLVLLIFLFRK